MPALSWLLARRRSFKRRNSVRIHIFDVEHGECAAIETPSGDLLLIGIGHNSSTGWRPSNWVRARRQRPHCIVLPNLDRDHLSDIHNFSGDIAPASIRSNTSVDPSLIRAIKIAQSGEVDPSVEGALRWIETVFTGGTIDPNYGIEKRYFNHTPEKFLDTNNLSVVTFLGYGGFGIMFPGDLEEDGWREFLGDPAFVDCLRRTTILVASHHGRSGGYCADIFRHCQPSLVVMSDKSIVHGTQEHRLYDAHCSGLNFGGQPRYVLTTRKDGKITIEVDVNGNYTVWIKQSY